MSARNIKTASLEELLARNAAGDLVTDPTAPDGPDLGKDFWKDATVRMPSRRRSVHLKLEDDVFQRFVALAGGKGHLTLMQNVLKSFVDAHSK